MKIIKYVVYEAKADKEISKVFKTKKEVIDDYNRIKNMYLRCYGEEMCNDFFDLQIRTIEVNNYTYEKFMEMEK